MKNPKYKGKLEIGEEPGFVGTRIDTKKTFYIRGTVEAGSSKQAEARFVMMLVHYEAKA